MVEVKVSRFEHSHDLDAFGRFSVEWDGRGGDELREQALESGHVGLEVTLSHEFVQAVDECVHAEEGLLEEGVGRLARLFPYMLEHLQQPIGYGKRFRLIGHMDVFEEQ